MKWINSDLVNVNQIKPIPNSSEYFQKTSLELIEYFLSDDVMELLIKESINYSRLKNNTGYDVTKEKIRSFLAILLISGYNKVRIIRNFWGNEYDVRNKQVVDVMRKETFFEIFFHHIHCASNATLTANDKYFKLEPLIDLLKGRHRTQL